MKTVMTQLRVRDASLWEAFKNLARDQHMSANGLLNQLIQQAVITAKAEK